MEKNKNKRNVSWALLASYLNGEANSEEKQAVDTWAALSEQNRAELDAARKILENSRVFYLQQKFDPAVAWENIRTDIQGSIPSPKQTRNIRGHSFRLRLLKIAASVVLAFLLGTAGYYAGFHPSTSADVNEVVSGEQQLSGEVLLPDGTRVALNDHSRLTYPHEFKGKLREVTIEGEAYFDVTPDEQRPFLINAGKAQIRVLGTSFNVSARPDRETVEVVVSSGKVELSCPEQKNSNTLSTLVVSPGEKAVFSNSAYQLLKASNDDLNAFAWKTHRLVFEENKLIDVINDLERVYHTDILLSDPAFNNLVYTASFDNQPIDFILEVIRLTFNMQLTTQNGQYIFTGSAINK